MDQLSMRNASDMWEQITLPNPNRTYFPEVRVLSGMDMAFRMLIKDRRSEDFSAVKGSDLDEYYLEEVMWST